MKEGNEQGMMPITLVATFLMIAVAITIWVVLGDVGEVFPKLQRVILGQENTFRIIILRRALMIAPVCGGLLVLLFRLVACGLTCGKFMAELTILVTATIGSAKMSWLLSGLVLDMFHRTWWSANVSIIVSLATFTLCMPALLVALDMAWKWVWPRVRCLIK